MKNIPTFNKVRQLIEKLVYFVILSTLLLMICGYFVWDWYNKCGYPGISDTVENPSSNKPIDANTIHELERLAIIQQLAHELDYNSAYFQRPTNLEFSSDGTYLAAGGGKIWGSGNNCGVIWLIDTGTLHLKKINTKILVTPYSSNPINNIHFSNNEKWLISQNHSLQITLWETISGRQIAILADKAGSESNSSDFLSDNLVIVAPYQSIIKMWDINTQQFIEFPPLSESAEQVTATTDYIAFITHDRFLRFVDIKQEKMINLHYFKNYASSPAFSPDGRFLAVSLRLQGIVIWDVTSQKEIITIPGIFFDDPIFSHDSKFVATDEGVWEINTQQQVIKFEADDSYVREVAFHPQGTMVTVGLTDGRIQFYAFPSKKLIYQIHIEGDSELKSIAFSPDGTLFAAALANKSYDSDGGKVIIWGIPQLEKEQ